MIIQYGTAITINIRYPVRAPPIARLFAGSAETAIPLPKDIDFKNKGDNVHISFTYEKSLDPSPSRLNCDTKNLTWMNYSENQF